MSAPDDDGPLAAPGLVIDADEVDAKLIVLKMRSAAHFTGGDLDLLQAHFGKGLDELTPGESAIATAYIYLRRAKVEGASWEMAANDVALEGTELTLPPTDAATSATSPSSADSGGALPAT